MGGKGRKIACARAVRVWAGWTEDVCEQWAASSSLCLTSPSKSRSPFVVIWVCHALVCGIIMLCYDPCCARCYLSSNKCCIICEAKRCETWCSRQCLYRYNVALACTEDFIKVKGKTLQVHDILYSGSLKGKIKINQIAQKYTKYSWNMVYATIQGN